MISRVQKWGNSLAVRIPNSLALQAGLFDDAAVQLSLVAGALVVQPVVHTPSLDELLGGVTDENMPCEWNTGLAVGKEAL